MWRTTKPVPVADACRLILAIDRLGDIDSALKFLGLARSELARSEEVESAEMALSGDLLEFFEGGDVESDSDSDLSADQQEDDRVKELLRGSLARPDEQDTHFVSRG